MWAGLVFPLLAGLLFWLTPLGRGLDRLSYDLLFLFKPAAQPKGVEIIYMDEKSFRELHQQPSDWDRSLHAALLKRLTKDKARLVVFDVWFSDRGTPAANEAFREAIKQNGKVVLAAIRSTDTVPGLNQASLLKPLDQFTDAAADWGIADLMEGPDGVVRQLSPDSELGPSLSSAALLAAGAEIPATGSENLWLNYYGPQGTIPSISYCDASNQPPGFFRGKVVFIGARPKALYAFGETEAFRTPYSRWGGAMFPGVEILATGYLNLERKEALARMPPLFAFGLITLAGLLLGGGMMRLSLPLAVGVGGCGILLVLLLALGLQSWEHIWFSWMIVAGVEVPAAFAWRLGTTLRTSGPASEFSAFLSRDKKHRIPNVPDHVLILPIGAGAYGEVWLAKNVMGTFRAVKFIFRDRFSDANPYLREFAGIKNYMPVSMNHPGLLHVLHVGEDAQKKFFFYIMEAGDDESAGQQIDPAKYKPKNLSKELNNRGQFPVEECVDMGLHLTTALGHLHKNGLIHRDIKPSNIIYVSGIPKLADVGLVTEVKDTPKNSTYVGTTGYIPPEGPGTASGDIYSLGKVLYEACMGRDRLDFPDLPTSVMKGSLKPGLLEFNEIILKACESAPSLRYQSAAEIHADLVRLQSSLKATRINSAH